MKLRQQIAVLLGEGRRSGGPLLFALLVAATLAACGGGPGGARPEPVGVAGIARPLESYRQLGLLTGPEQFPAVAGFSTLAGPADSTYVAFGLSLPNRALRFQRETAGFRAEYTVSLVYRQDTVEVRRIDREEVVRVPAYADTERSDESIIFQSFDVLAPGRYVVAVEARDVLSGRGFRGEDTLMVPAYGLSGERMGGPVVVYRAGGREHPGERPDLILNPRRSIPYGADPPRLYLEWYGSEPVTVMLRLADEDGGDLWSEERDVQLGEDGLRYLIADVPSATLPLGRVRLEVSDHLDRVLATSILVTVSDQWVVANFDEVLQFVSYIASPAEMDSLRAASGVERQRLWERFWARRDPLPATPINEFREAFFERVRTASEQFREAGRPGWRTDRGEVFIVLGRPDTVVPRQIRDRTGIGTESGSAVEWYYERAPGGRLSLLFVDQAGFGQFELTPSSRSAFRSATERLRPRS